VDRRRQFWLRASNADAFATRLITRNRQERPDEARIELAGRGRPLDPGRGLRDARKINTRRAGCSRKALSRVCAASGAADLATPIAFARFSTLEP